MQLIKKRKSTRDSIIKSVALCFLVCIATNIKAQPVNPQPGENIWHLTAAIGTALDECCYTLGSKIDTVSTGSISASCDLSGTYTVLQALGLCNATPLIVPSAGTIITQPGVYCLTADVALDPSASIVINTSDVVLDLNKHTVASQPQSPAEAAIIINNSGTFQERIIVRNGFILGNSFTGNAVLINNDTNNSALIDLNLENFDVAITNNNNIQNFDFTTIKIDSTTSGGMILSNAVDCQITDCSVARDAGGTTGFNIVTQSSRVKFKNCNVAASTGFIIQSAAAGAIFSFEECSAAACGFQVVAAPLLQVTFLNCVTQGGGFNFSGSSTNNAIILDNCLADSSSFNIATVGGTCRNCSTASGSFNISADQWEFINCSANGGSFVVAKGVAKCLFDTCSSSNSTSAGFSLSGPNCIIRNSSSHANTLGFRVDNNAANVSLNNCVASSNSGNGFDLSAAGTCCSVGQSEALSNTGTGFLGNGTNVSFYTNYANCNGTNFNATSASSAVSGKLDSKVDALAIDFAGTFTALNGITSSLDIIATDFNGTFTALAMCCSCNPVPLTLPTTGTTLSLAGVYCLTQDQPALGAANSLTITVSNVVLDLNGHTITGGGSTATIFISSLTPLSNITIKNGSIISSSSAIASDVATQYNALSIENITIVSATGNGLNLNNVGNSIIKNVQAHSCASGFNFVSVSNSLIEDCTASNATATGFAVSGASAGTLYRNCENSGSVNGFTIAGSGNPRFDSSSSDSSSSNGFVLTTTASLTNCYSANSTSGNGFTITGASMNVVNCIAEKNSLSGFAATGSTGLLEQCTASFNGLDGFNFGDAGNNNNTLTNCVAFTNGQHGFDFDNAGSRNTTIGCIATNNTQNGFSFVGPVSGTTTANIIESCTATRNRNFGFAATTTFATAFFFLNKASVNVAGNYSINTVFSAPVVVYGPAMTGVQFGSNLSSQ